MSLIDKILSNLPEVSGPTQKKLSFNQKLKWTGIILVMYFILGLVPLFGLGENALSRFEYLAIILGAEFGSLISLGIGPIVTGSIVLQLLNGSGIVKFDLASAEGKKRYQGIQKSLSIFFIIFESGIYVFMGGLAPLGVPGTTGFFIMELILIFQLILGGLLILMMDEVISKWGFGSGISLFIASNVSLSLFVRTFSWLHPQENPEGYVGAIPNLFVALSIADSIQVTLILAAIIATVVVFILAVYVQSMKVEIPLSFGRIRGHGIRWPLSFIYTSNIPVILVAAMIANIQLWAKLLQNWGYPLLGTFSQSNVPETGLISILSSPNIVDKIIKGTLTLPDVWKASLYILFFIVGCVIFSIFWVQSSGMDARSQAKQMMSSGLTIPGWRKDERVLESILSRYIWPLTIMGAITVGFLAAFADLSGALANGTGILLTVMIIYKLYEDIARQHAVDMFPGLKKVMKVE